MTDNIDAGEMAAKEMLTMLHDTGNSPQESLEVGILLSSDASQAMVNRVSGFLDYGAKYAPTKWEITKDIALNGGDVKKAESDAAKLLKKNENIKGIYGCNNTSTVGIAKTLTKQKRTDIVMVGFDMAEYTGTASQGNRVLAVLVLGIILLVSVMLVWFCKPPQEGTKHKIRGRRGKQLRVSQR